MLISNNVYAFSDVFSAVYFCVCSFRRLYLCLCLPSTFAFFLTYFLPPAVNFCVLSVTLSIIFSYKMTGTILLMCQADKLYLPLRLLAHSFVGLKAKREGNQMGSRTFFILFYGNRGKIQTY
jgi:hypothetical protein